MLKITDVDQISYTTALYIGVFQVLALIPGTSRSGATIVGALTIGVSRVAAAELSPFTRRAGHVLRKPFEIVKFRCSGYRSRDGGLDDRNIGRLVVSLARHSLFNDIHQKRSFTVFGWYRILLGANGCAVFLYNNQRFNDASLQND